MEMNKEKKDVELSNKSMNFNSFASHSLTNITKDSYVYATTVNVNNNVTSPTKSLSVSSKGSSINERKESIIQNEDIRLQLSSTMSAVENSFANMSNTTTKFSINFNDTNLSVFKNQQVIPDTNPENNILDNYSKVNIFSEFIFYFFSFKSFWFLI